VFLKLVPVLFKPIKQGLKAVNDAHVQCGVLTLRQLDKTPLKVHVQNFLHHLWLGVDKPEYLFHDFDVLVEVLREHLLAVVKAEYGLADLLCAFYLIWL
jgi:hypothetical protein